jgi:hypothetical protein
MAVMLPGSTNLGLLTHTGSGRDMMEILTIVMAFVCLVGPTVIVHYLGK